MVVEPKVPAVSLLEQDGLLGEDMNLFDLPDAKCALALHVQCAGQDCH